MKGHPEREEVKISSRIIATQSATILLHAPRLKDDSKECRPRLQRLRSTTIDEVTAREQDECATAAKGKTSDHCSRYQ